MMPLMRKREKFCRVGQATDCNIIYRMRNACWMPKATNTHSEYVIIIASVLQNWLHECVSMLRYTYIAFLVKCPFYHDYSPSG
jgi:hypothetical protein